MSIHINPAIRRGSIVRAFIPHSGETDLWPRSLLIHGFVFKKGEAEPHAIAASRFSYNTAKILQHDIVFPVADQPVIARLNEKNLMLRTNRIDIIPLYEEFFTPSLKKIAYVQDSSFWHDVSKALEKGLKGHQAENSLFLELGPDDILLSRSTKDSKPAWFPGMISGSQYRDYELALYERSRQMMEKSRQLHKDFMLSASTKPAFIQATEEALKAETIAEDVMPVAEISKTEPWWKQNPELLAKLIEEANFTQPAKKKIKPERPENVIADLSALTSLFNGIEIKRAGAEAQADVAKPAALPAKKSSARPVIENTLSENFCDTSFENFQLKRGNILVIPSPFSPGLSDRGIVWNLFKDENGNIAGADVIPCRHESDGFANTVKICDPVDFHMNGTVVVIDQLVRIATTEDMVYATPSNGKFLNPYFQKRIEEARLKYDGHFTIHGLTEMPDGWNIKTIEPFKPSPWHLGTYMRLMQEEHRRLFPAPELQPVIS
ncbi:MAG: hypothetical protein DI586_00305 [Micavibrio aeruginosavorus]|uniref:Uncharacterized protein n=1 Tax=Micavibrio aeruginosavorus TaxID=349221 RepID=A0A2W5HPL1_9BACT|nr:MAG: hypothetical protein DI586_00305 [Micavibrio aeruginosavorus]